MSAKTKQARLKEIVKKFELPEDTPLDYGPVLQALVEAYGAVKLNATPEGVYVNVPGKVATKVEDEKALMKVGEAISYAL